MIRRYTRPQMGSLWEPDHIYTTWLKVEIAACEAMAEEGLIPSEAVETIRKKASFSSERILKIEEETKHDVIAFLTNVAEYVGPDARFIHMGLTSSDVLDTSLAIILREAMDIIMEGVKTICETIKARAVEHRDTVMIGRSHGVHAEPITFGLKLAVWYSEMQRNLKRLSDARDVIAFGKLSGAVGTFANVSPGVETRACERLGLKPAPISTQILQRDRHAQYFMTLAILAGTLEKIAVEIRHLQRTEVLEAEEPFGKGQKGSSAMPHKKNPVGCENIAGLARVVRANALASLENMPLWHERDISHSSVERIIGPDSTILIDYMVTRLNGIIKGLVVHPENMEANLNKTGGLIFSQQVLLALAEKGMQRQKAYEIVQRNAMAVWKGEGNFKALLLKDKDIKSSLSPVEIDKIFDLGYHVKHVSDIFERVFSQEI